MQFIRHRINTIGELRAVDVTHGCEIDLRTNVTEKGSLHLSHDPWIYGETFDKWLSVFIDRKIQGPIIFNTKEDGLEEHVISLCKTLNFENYFFLDTAAPTQIKFLNSSLCHHFAIRVSRFEGVEYLNQFKGKVSWVWVDCFEGAPMDANILKEIAESFKICLVSPELQKAPKEQISNFKALYSLATAVCTKHPELWKNL